MAINFTRPHLRIAAVGVTCVVALLAGKSFLGERDASQQRLLLQAGFLKDGVQVQPLVDGPAAATRDRHVATILPAEPPTPYLAAPQITHLPEDLGRAEYQTKAEAIAAIAAANPPAPTPVRPGWHRPPVQVTRAESNPAMQRLVPPAPSRQQAADQGTTDCTPEFKVSGAAAGLARAKVIAPCHAGHSVILAHAGLAVDVFVPDAGRLTATLPVLDNRQPFTATLDDGLSAHVVLTGASALAFDHIVLQWQGDTGLQLHALEFGADYGDAGHVWSGAPKQPSRSQQGAGGFLTRLGDPALGGVAEIYTYPVGRMEGEGAVSLTVEAEVSAQNCGSDIAGQILQRSAQGEMTTVEVAFAMPDCDAVGDILVLKNILQGVKIAAN